MTGRAGGAAGAGGKGPAGLPFSPVGLGTWKIEGSPRASVDALRRGLDEGANHIDTAEMYGSGGAERLVGEAVKGRRDGVFLVSKVLPSNASYEGTLRACERTLKNLGTDRLDVYLLHWRGSFPLDGTFRAFEKLKRDGKILAFGVSNFDLEDLEEAERLAGPGNIACNQVLYHLGERAVEFGVLPWCRERGVPVVAYSPLGEGRLAGDGELARLAGARGATPAQVALSFLVNHKGVIAIPKSSDAGRAAENVRAAALELSAPELARLEKAFPAKRKPSLPML